MKSRTSKLIFLFVFLLCTLISCNKDKGDDDESNYRVIAEAYFYNGDTDGEATIEYLNDKVSEYRYDEDEDYYEEATFDYSEANKIRIEYTSFEEGEEYEGVMEITLEDGKVIEFMEDGSEKYTLTYNGSDQVEKIKTYYDDGIDWILFATIAFEYDGDKLMEVLYEETEGEKSKDVYTYDGDHVDEIISSYYSGSDWIEDDKDVYSYASGRVTKIEYYYNYEGDWEKGDYMEFSYDENGNLTETAEISDEYDDEYVTEYTYEKGSGNYRLIFGNFYFNDDGFVDYPMPTKSALRDGDVSGIKNTISLCRSLKNHHSLTIDHSMHNNRSSAGRNK
jgi:hypothetical protein